MSWKRVFQVTLILVVVNILWCFYAWRRNEIHQVDKSSGLYIVATPQSLRNQSDSSLFKEFFSQYERLEGLFNLSSAPCFSSKNFIKCAEDTVLNPWKQNKRKHYLFRKLMKVELMSDSQGKPLKITTKPFNNLTKNWPFPPAQELDLCSVVGSSGTLLGSHCGNAIDKADFVMRANLPPLIQFAKDAGRKANYTTINPRGVIRDRYNNLKDKENRISFAKHLDEYPNTLFLVANPNYFKVLNMTKKNITIIGQNNSQGVKFNMRKFWRKIMKTNFTALSTGLTMVTYSLTFCKETHLYGFWPFSQTSGGQNISYHYYDDVDVAASRRVHAMPTEFQALLQLHQEGILKVHLGKCPQ